MYGGERLKNKKEDLSLSQKKVLVVLENIRN
jgi:hypothetical protein